MASTGRAPGAPASNRSDARSVRRLGVLALAGLAASGVGCGNGDDTTSPTPAPVPDAAVDATKDGAKAASDATGGADVEAGAAEDVDAIGPADATSPAVASLRVANWSSDAPAVDFCIARHGTTAFAGPLLGTHAASRDAGAAALPFPGVSSYFGVAPGQYDARLVAAGATGCSTKIVADATALPTLLAGGAATIALVGTIGGDAGTTGLRTIGFADDAPAAGALALRFIDAVPSPGQVDIWMGSGASLQPLYLGIPFGAAGTAAEARAAAIAADASSPGVDSNGYEVLPAALVGTTFAARFGAADGGGAAASGNVTSALGVTLTIAILPLGGSTVSDAGPTAQLLECVDNAGTVGLLGNCSVISQ